MMRDFAVFDHATKRYNNHTALADCCITVHEGEVLGIAGPNGAGKTTMARLLLGFTRPSSGSVTILGDDPVERRRRHGVGYAPEEASRPWRLTLRELLAAGNLSSPDDLGRESVVAMLGLEHLLDKRIHQLSKGQWRMCIIAYAMVGSCTPIVLDEPDSGLDPAALDRLQTAVRACTAHGSTVVMLSHNLDELERACDRIMIIHDGRVAGSFGKAQFADEGMRNIYRSTVPC